MSNLYKIIEGLCEAKGIKVGKMCSDIGIQRSIMGNLSSGKTKRLSTKTLEKISAYFKVPVDYFLDFGEPNPNDIPPEPPISDSQFMFALWGDVKDEMTDEDLEEVRKFAHMKYLERKDKNRKKKEGG